MGAYGMTAALAHHPQQPASHQAQVRDESSSRASTTSSRDMRELVDISSIGTPKAPGMALETIRQVLVGQTLTPPFLDQDHETTPGQFADHLEILLDGL